MIFMRGFASFLFFLCRFNGGTVGKLGGIKMPKEKLRLIDSQEFTDCPFCKEGKMTKQAHPLFIYWHRKRRGYWRSKLQPIECNKCGIIVFKRIADQ